MDSEMSFDERTCSCGHVWLMLYCVPTERSENLICRCGTIFAKSVNGSIKAILLSPKEKFAALRIICYIVGFALLQAANLLRIKLPSNSWLSPHRIMAYRHLNAPVRSYVPFD
ncbi:hypothetical protein HDF16_005236 [Granulicella aggregans]|uniref:Uncharacterized protein n=1 Tax=Granulicella aggregans TaxID=474949 RepID=A0A7W8E7P8_9BACT|nr:hypothetical protein [Granulicella aggregans]